MPGSTAPSPASVCAPGLGHTDLGLHNLVFAADLRTPLGIIDFDAAACADRHYDFRYLALATGDTPLLDSACAAYREAGGAPLDRRRILTHDAASAVCYLAHRAGIAPEAHWCGRTLAEDLAWTEAALRRALA